MVNSDDVLLKVNRNGDIDDGDLDLWPNHPKINRVLTLPQGNHAAKFGKDPKIIHNTPSLLTINNTSSLLTINNTSGLVNHQ
jgi:hypothetical protein